MILAEGAYDPPPKERKDENAGIIIENSEMAD